jgi:hypothetical protein
MLYLLYQIVCHTPGGGPFMGQKSTVLMGLFFAPYD